MARKKGEDRMRGRGTRSPAGVLFVTALGLFSTVAGVSAQDTPAPGDALRPLNVDDLFRMRRVGAPVISPDGEWVAYTVSQTSLEDESSEIRIWIVPITGGDAVPMTAPGKSAGSPAWSPDGRALTFLRSQDEGQSGEGQNGEGRTQVWALDRRGGEAVALTDVEQGVSGYRWSPDATRLLLSIRDAEPEEEGEEEGDSETPQPWVIDRLQFKRDGQGYLDRRRTHLYVYELATENLVQITSGDFDDSGARWSPDGLRVAFSSNRTDEADSNSNSDIWVVVADNTDQGQTLLRITSNPGADSSPAWSPDGQSIAYTTVTEPEKIWYATRHLAIAAAQGGEERVLTEELDRNVSSPRFSADGRTLYFGLEDSAENHLGSIDVRSGEIRRPIAGSRRVGSYDIGPDGTLAALISELSFPGEIFVGEDSALRQLTHENRSWLSELRLAEVRNIHFPSRDGTEIEGFLHLPPGFQEGLRYPTLLRIHGGPVSQYSNSFNFEAQLFAAHGYVVVTTNPRGSSGKGQEFSYALWADWGNRDFEDVMAGVDYAIREGYADPEQLGVGGWSYGGILTNYVITKTDRFKGAITGASEVLYIANYGHDHYQLQWEMELGLPWESRDAWERISPFNDVDKVVTPTLIMGGERDWNVPIQNSEQLYQALRRRGVETQLVVYPNQGHGIRVPSYQKDRYERYLAWYNQHVRGRPMSDEDGSGPRP